jgi:hypothetical protein
MAFFTHPKHGPHSGDPIGGVESQKITEAEFWALSEQREIGQQSADPQATLRHYSQLAQDRLDAKARERLYDGILSRCSYATSTHWKFRAEGRAGVVWRDETFATAYSVLGQVQDGTAPIPTEGEFLAALPPLLWPDEVGE